MSITKMSDSRIEGMKSRKKAVKRIFWKNTLKGAVMLIIVGLLLRYFVFLPSEINGISMSPALQEGDQILVDTFTDIERFDVVVFRDKGAKPVVKRVIGLPGDTLYYHNDQLFVNGEALEEPYLNSVADEGMSGLLTSNFTLDQVSGSPVIPEGEYFVLGDNRRYSFDSRHYGNIAKSSIIGEVKLIYYPIDRFSLLKVKDEKQKNRE